MASDRFSRLYRWRFLPLSVTAPILTAVAVFKYVLQTEVGSAFGWAVALAVSSFIWLQAMREHARDKKAAEERAAAPPPCEAEIKAQRRSEIQAAIERQWTNIAFRSPYLFFSIIILLVGVTLIVFNKEYGFGGVMLASGVFFIIHSALVLRRWVRLLRALKVEKREHFGD
jgi:hypothetical protein